jgi:hypothetical protein
LGTSSETHESLIPRSSPELERRAAVTAATRTAAAERHPFPTLPPGWAVIGRCRFGTGKPGPEATGCYALAHPEVGVALIDIAPDATPNAEARLRRALTAMEFWPDYPGTLPVVHDRVDATALRSLPWILERGFTAQPALTISGGTAWIEGVQRAMAADPAWELPGQPKAQVDAPSAPADEVEGGDEATPPPRSRSVRPRRWGRLAALALAFAATFAVGLVTGFVLLDSPASIAPQPVVTALPQPAPAPPPPSSAAVPADTAPRPAETTASAATTPAATTPAAATPAAPPSAATTPSVAGAPAQAPATVVSTAPVPAPAAAPIPLAATPAPSSQTPAPAPDARSPAAPAELAAAPNGSGGAPAPAASHPPAETQVSHAAPAEHALPMAPPPAPVPPPVRVSSTQQAARQTPVIDRACSQALFRFQQGERLTAAEQNFIRTGCSTGRR